MAPLRPVSPDLFLKLKYEGILVHVGEKKTLLNNILHTKASWIGHVLRRNYFLHDTIEGQMTEECSFEKQ